MKRIFLMAVKDLRLLLRDRMGAFFVLGFPLLMGLFFGMIMGGNSGESSGKMKVAIVDQDESTMSRRFVEALAKNDNLTLETVPLEAARESVRRGERVGAIVLPVGFGENAGILWQTPPTIKLGMDPSRGAESAMIQGFVMQAMGELVGDRFQKPGEMRPTIDQARQQLDDDPTVDPIQKQLMSTFLDSVDQMLDSAEQTQQNDPSANPLAGQGGVQFVDIQPLDITRQVDPNSPQAELKKLDSKWDISFPQGMMWGVLGCVAGFAISIARERTLGTLLRLQVAPISRFSILAGKALACFLAVLGVIGLLTLLGALLGMRPDSYPRLAVAAVSVAFCFVGIMMTLAVLGRTEQSVGGIGWAANLVMAMFGGAMVPVMFMPAFFQRFSMVSPIRWALLAIEGAIWRQFSWSELLLPCGVLIGIGGVGLLIGTVILSRTDR